MRRGWQWLINSREESCCHLNRVQMISHVNWLHSLILRLLPSSSLFSLRNSCHPSISLVGFISQDVNDFPCRESDCWENSDLRSMGFLLMCLFAKIYWGSIYLSSVILVLRPYCRSCQYKIKGSSRGDNIKFCIPNSEKDCQVWQVIDKWYEIHNLQWETGVALS